MTQLAAKKKAPRRPALRYRGGKWRLAPWIISHFPAHECYVEPFCGGASVLFKKEPSLLECINDLDGDVVAFFRVLRTRPDDLVEACMLTPYAREELKYCHRPAPEGDDLEKARRLFVRSQLGFGASGKQSGMRFQKETYGWGKNFPREMKSLDHFKPLSDRLAQVQIECQKDALEVIRRMDRPKNLFYLDPPYLAENRSGRLYRKEMMGEAEHRELADLLHGIKGMAIISGGESALYRELYKDWRMESREHMGEQQKRYTECLWISPAVDEAHRVAAEAERVAAEAAERVKPQMELL